MFIEVMAACGVMPSKKAAWPAHLCSFNKLAISCLEQAEQGLGLISNIRPLQYHAFVLSAFPQHQSSLHIKAGEV